MRDGLKAKAVEKVGQSSRVPQTRHYRIEQNRTELFCWYSIKYSTPAALYEVRSLLRNNTFLFDQKTHCFAFLRKETEEREIEREMGKGK
jgi:hypothetical protein